MCVRAPASLPGLQVHYPHPHRSPSKCSTIHSSPLINDSSPSSSEDSASPTDVSCYRRLGERAGERLLERGSDRERPPLMRRLARGFGGTLLSPDDDDSTPLVTDTPTTPTAHIPMCVNGGYINESIFDSERRSAGQRGDANANQPSAPTADDAPRNHFDDFSTHISKHCASSTTCSLATSSSSGASSVGSCRGANLSAAAVVAALEPELRHAPWFQAGIPREIALEVLSGLPAGAFLVRASTTARDCLALSLRAPGAPDQRPIVHYLIHLHNHKYRIKGFTKEFSSLTALVTHHSVMPELLPCPLALARPQTVRRDHADLTRVRDYPSDRGIRYHANFCPQDV